MISDASLKAYFVLESNGLCDLKYYYFKEYIRTL